MIKSWPGHPELLDEISIQILLCREVVAAAPQTAMIAINIFLRYIFLLAIISFNIQHHNIKMKLRTLTSVATTSLSTSIHTETSCYSPAYTVWAITNSHLGHILQHKANSYLKKKIGSRKNSKLQHERNHVCFTHGSTQ